MQRVTFLLCVAAIGCATQQTSAVPVNGRPQAIGEGGKADGDDDDDDATIVASDDDTTRELYGYTDAPGDVWYVPGEFEPTDSMLVAWPGTYQNDWEAALVANALRYIRVRIVTPAENVEAIRATLFVEHDVSDDALAEIDWITEEDLGGPTPRHVWMRDFGPLVAFTAGAGRRIIDFGYDPIERPEDNALPTRLASYWDLPVSRPPFELEGGNFQSNGQGICVVSTRAVTQNQGELDDERAEEQVRTIMTDYLNCGTTLIVPRLAREGTGHIDMYVHLTGAATAIVGEYTEEQDPDNKTITDEGATILENAGFSVTRIPMPTPEKLVDDDGILVGEVFRSYTNALAINDAVLVPVYPSDTAGEETALATFGDHYPGRVLVPLDADEIIDYGGAIHCTTMSIGDVPE